MQGWLKTAGICFFIVVTLCCTAHVSHAEDKQTATGKSNETNYTSFVGNGTRPDQPHYVLQMILSKDIPEFTNTGTITSDNTLNKHSYSNFTTGALIKASASTLFINEANISITSKSSSLLNYLWGIKYYGEIMTNSGSGNITINATGVNHSMHNSEVYAYGIYSYSGAITNNGKGDITAKVTGKAGDYTSLKGIYTRPGMIVNSGYGDITARATGKASADIDISGLHSESGAIDNSGHGDITATIEGEPTTNNVNARIYGLHSESGAIDNSGHGDITATIEGEPTTNKVIAWIYGIYTKSGAIVNNGYGDITATAGGGGHTTNKLSVTINGLHSTQGTITNSGYGNIFVKTKGKPSTNSDINATGLHTESGAIINNGSGNITAEAEAEAEIADHLTIAAKSFGIYSRHAAITNSGTGDITAKAKGGTYVSASGITSGNRAVTNSGTGNITAKAEGGTTTSATACASGISSSSGAITNSGTGNIIATAKGGTATTGFTSTYAKAYGITSDSGALINNATGDIYVMAKGGSATHASSRASASASATAYGITSNSGAITNSGTGNITVEANGGTATTTSASASASTSAYAKAYGIFSGKNSSTITNTQKISATATAGTKNIIGTITSDNAFAYGIYFEGSGAHTLSSSGLIEVVVHPSPLTTAGYTPTAHQVHLENYDAKLLIKNYAMEFQGTQAKLDARYSGCIYAKGGAGKVTFAADATLYAYAPKKLNVTYDIPNLVAGETKTYDQFATLNSERITAINPDVKAELISGKGVRKQQLKLSYEPDTSPTHTGSEAVKPVQTRVQNIVRNEALGTLAAASPALVTGGVSSPAVSFSTVPSSSFAPPAMSTPFTGTSISTDVAADIHGDVSTMVASADDTIVPTPAIREEKRNYFFVRPVYGNSQRDDSGSGYKADSFGVSAGYTRKIQDNLLLGMHGGYTYTDLDYTGERYDKRSEDINTFFAGIHGVGTINTNWVISAMSTFFYADHDYRDNNPTFRETAEYGATTLRTEVSGGYSFVYGSQQFLPELALTHVWQHSDSYSTNNLDDADTTYGTLDNHELYGTVRFHWMYKQQLSNGWNIAPSLGIGVTQLLTDGKISNTMSVNNASQLVVDQEDYTTITPSCSLTVEKDNKHLTFSYEGGFSDRIRNNLFSLQAGVTF